MEARVVVRFEKLVDCAASALLAGACAFAAYELLPAQPAGAAVAAVVGGFISLRLLAAVRPRARRLPVPIFDVRDVEPIELPELLLTERAPSATQDALVLDDILERLGPDSRVVRLFDPAAMPTAGELKSRIDHHLGREASAAQSADAAQALHEALAELRRSLR